MLEKIRRKLIVPKKVRNYTSERVKIFPYVLDLNLAYGTGVLANYNAYEELYFSSVDVATAIDLIAQFAITEMNFVGNEKDVEKMTEFAKQVKLRSRLINDVRAMLIYGNSFEYLASSEGIEMQYLNPKRVKVLINEFGDIEGYEYFAGDEQVKLPAERVLHFAYGRIGNSPYGYSFVHQAYNAIVLKKKLELMSAILAYKMGHPLLHAKVNNPAMIPEVEKVLSNRVQTNYSPQFVEDQIAIVNQIITDDAVDIQVLESKLDLAGLVEMIKYLQTQIDKALKVPKIFYGEPEGSNRATSYTQLKTFSLFLQSIRAQIKEELEAKLIPLLGIDVEIVFDEITIDEEFAWGDLAVQLFQAGIIDTNEARELIGFPPIERE